MQQFLIYGGSQNDRGEHLKSAWPADNYLYLHLSGVENSLKIIEVRELQRALSTTSSRPRLVWIEEANQLTLPAQHALLKILEEPPTGVTIALTLPARESLLPTLVSRLKLVRLTTTLPDLDPSQLKLVKQALSASPGERVELARQLGNKRKEAEAYFVAVIQTLYQLMQQEKSHNSLKLLTQVSSLAHLALERIRANVNVQLTLESFFLTLPRTR